MILAFETSTQICSVAYQNNRGEVFEKNIKGRSVHSDHLFLFTQELIREHNFNIYDITTVLVSNGPGSYTGLRIAASAIKGLFFGSNADVYAVNTLASFAMAAKPQNGETIHAIMDARRTHVYHQVFTMDEELISDSAPKIIEITELEQQLQGNQVLSGTGISRIDSLKLKEIRCVEMEQISAKSLVKLYESLNSGNYCIKTDIEELNPNYISSSQVNNSSVKS